jgi:hypothetical protein
MLYDVGQILGGMVGGFISDKMGVRSPVVVVMLLFSWYELPGLVLDRHSYGANDSAAPYHSASRSTSWTARRTTQRWSCFSLAGSSLEDLRT